MNDMSAQPIIDTDEFGGLDHLVLPGEDPRLLHRMHDAFTAQLKPDNFIFRLWARDMAIETYLTEYIRIANCAVQRHLLEEECTDAAVQAQEEVAPSICGEADETGSRERTPRPRFDARLAKAFIENLDLITGLLSLERELMQERDRLIFIYETRTLTAQGVKDAERKFTKRAKASGD